MHTNTKKIIKIMEQLAPPEYKESWDNIGLMVGNSNKMIEKVMVALEVTEAVIDEAVNKNVDMIISHHPLIYKPLKKLVLEDPISKMVMRLLSNDINLYVAHTNLDAADQGTCNYICQLLELNRIEYLQKDYSTKLFKIQTYVPNDHVRAVKTALSDAGAGQIETYSDCAFMVEGQGEFKPLEGSDPFIGSKDELESVNETKIETTVQEHYKSSVIKALLKSHPYEVPAYDVILLENKMNETGVGKYGFLKERMTLRELAIETKDILEVDHVKVTGDLDKKISSVAVITGAGDDYLSKVSKVADVLITGDMKYHMAQYALQLGLTVIDAGHYGTEQVYMNRLKPILEDAFEAKSYDVTVIQSEVNIDPFQLI